MCRGRSSLVLAGLVVASGCYSKPDAPGGAPFTDPADIAIAQTNPVAIAVDGDGVYWLDQMEVVSGMLMTTGTLMKAAKVANSEPLLLTDAIPGPAALGQNATNLIVSANNESGGDYQLMFRQPKLGGTADSFLVTTGQTLSGVSVVGNMLFYVVQSTNGSQGWVEALPLDDWDSAASTTVEIAHDTMGGVVSATVLAASTDSVFVATNGEILQIASSMDGPRSVFAQTNGNAQAIVLDSGVVYWAEASSVRSLAVNSPPGTTPTDLATGQASPRGLAIFGDDVFWTSSGDGTVWRAFKEDGSGPSEIATQEVEPVGIAVDEDGAVYWTDYATGHIRFARPNGS